MTQRSPQEHHCVCTIVRWFSILLLLAKARSMSPHCPVFTALCSASAHRTLDITLQLCGLQGSQDSPFAEAQVLFPKLHSWWRGSRASIQAAKFYVCHFNPSFRDSGQLFNNTVFQGAKVFHSHPWDRGMNSFSESPSRHRHRGALTVWWQRWPSPQWWEVSSSRANCACSFYLLWLPEVFL